MEKNGKDKKKYEAPAIVLLGELATAIGAEICKTGTGARGNCSTGYHATGGEGGCSTGDLGIPCNIGSSGN
jgi:hypothetical protein